MWNVIGFARKAQDIVRNKNTAQEKIMTLQKQKEQLTKDIDNLNTQNGVEETIRDKFGLAKEGEGLIVVVDNQDQTPQTTLPTPTVWERIKNFFK
jgi:cell division protein FtsB